MIHNIVNRICSFFRHNEHQIGYLEDKAHRARVRKHGSNYLLETYLNGLSEAVYPDPNDSLIHDKNSDSGVMTEGDSEQSNANNAVPKLSRPSEVSLKKTYSLISTIIFNCIIIKRKGKFIS